MPTWPGTLPQSPLVDGYGRTEPDNLIRSSVDVGPAIVRRRTTAAVGGMKWPQWYDPSQKTAFRAFYNDDLNSGALAFDLPDPEGGAALSVRIVSPPQWGEVSGNYQKMTMDLEVLP